MCRCERELIVSQQSASSYTPDTFSQAATNTLWQLSAAIIADIDPLSTVSMQSCKQPPTHKKGLAVPCTNLLTQVENMSPKRSIGEISIIIRHSPESKVHFVVVSCSNPFSLPTLVSGSERQM